MYFYYFIVAISSLVILTGFVTLIQRIRLFLRSVKVDGKVVDWKESRRFVNHRESIVYSAVVAFNAADGSSHRIESSSGGSKKPQVGRTIPVRYDPGNPANAVVATFVNFWVVPFVLLAAGVFVLWLGHMFGAGG